jgi:hypothetical protein
VIGSLFAIAVIVGIIIICVKKSNERQGRVICNDLPDISFEIKKIKKNV